MDFTNCMDKQSDNLWVECLHLHVLHMLNHDVPRRIKDVMRFSASFVRGIPCILELNSTDGEISRSSGVTRQFILLTRDYNEFSPIHIHGSVYIH